MTHEFDAQYWQEHWQERPIDVGTTVPVGVNPYLVAEVGGLTPGTALEAGCGEGAEAVWLAIHGWSVTAVDISAEALGRAREGARPTGSSDLRGDLEWVNADLSEWEPEVAFDLVTTFYAHPSIPQLDFYERIAAWVAPGGTLVIVGHAHDGGHAHEVPAAATVSSTLITLRLDADDWDVVTSDEHDRNVTAPDGRSVALHDVVVRATRRT